MEAIIWTIGIALVAGTWGVTAIHYRRQTVALKTQHKLQLKQRWYEGHNDGWCDALKDPRAIRAASKKLNLVTR